ncbi:phosphoribosylaminoimidazolesuccinocarboxamide synthase [bacterium]|nr:phosphoribosylaminoimidazolesuccinocarboxamide synthase [bacterium]
MLYEGKAKRLYRTDDPDLLIMEYKDDLTAFDATKRGSSLGKGAINNAVSALLMGRLNDMHVETSFQNVIDANHSLVRNVEIVPIEVIIRFEAHGSLCRRYGIEAGLVCDPPLYEICYKNDDLHDPFITDQIAVLMGLATYDELAKIRYMALTIGHTLREIYLSQGIKLLDFKLEFGRYQPAGESSARIILADEITPDTCRLVDAETGEKLDKDLFRFDMGDLGEGYRKLLDKLQASAG